MIAQCAHNRRTECAGWAGSGSGGSPRSGPIDRGRCDAVFPVVVPPEQGVVSLKREIPSPRGQLADSHNSVRAHFHVKVTSLFFPCGRAIRGKKSAPPLSHTGEGIPRTCFLRGFSSGQPSTQLAAILDSPGSPEDGKASALTRSWASEALCESASRGRGEEGNPRLFFRPAPCGQDEDETSRSTSKRFAPPALRPAGRQCRLRPPCRSAPRPRREPRPSRRCPPASRPASGRPRRWRARCRARW